MLHRLALFTGSVVLLVVGVAAQAVTADTRFSENRGLHYTPLQVTVSSTSPGAVIRYTLDCSDPRTSANTAQGPSPLTITIDPQSTNGGLRPLTPAVVLRAFATAPGMLPSNVDTQTYVFPDRVLLQTRPAGFSTSFSYDMDQSIVNGPTYSGRIRDDLAAIPSMSIVAPYNSVFGGNGLLQAGNGSIEVPGSIEVMHPGGRDDQADCGLVPHSWSQQKRSLRIYFRSNHGTDKWRHDLFRASAEGAAVDVTSFDDLVLRAGFNDGLLYNEPARRGRYSFAVDELGRSSQIALTGCGSRGLFVHLYLNGLYWGMYNPIERPEASFLSDVFGGDKADFFARNHSGTLDGSPTWFNGLIASANNWSAVQQRLDVTSFSDYVIYWNFCGGGDWPSVGGSNNNWYAGNRNLPQPGKVRFWMWDSEDSWINLPNRPQSPLDGARLNVELLTGSREISQLWRGLQANSEFRATFADRVYQQCFNDGPLSEAAMLRRWNRITDAVDHGVVGESARWGRFDPRRVTWTRDGDWLPYTNSIRDMFIGNGPQLVAALRSTSVPVPHPALYPSIDPPLFQLGGQTIEVTRAQVASGTQLALARAGPFGAIYYTLDGSDPRGAGGAPVGTPAGAGATITITGPVVLKARSLAFAIEWSALHTLRLDIRAGIPLEISEFLAENTVGLADEAGDHDDWIELRNRGPLPLDVSGYHLSDDPLQPTAWTLPAGSFVPANGTLLVWADNEPLEGPLHATFRLSGNGESVLLHSAGGVQLDRIDFGPQRDDVSEGRLDEQPGVLVTFERPSPDRFNRPEPCGHVRYQARVGIASPLRLRGKGIPMPGEQLHYELEGLAPGAPALLAVGLQAQSVDFPGIGTLLVAPLFSLSAVADPSGEARFGLALPDFAAARDATLYVQGVADPGLGLRLSNGVISRTAW